MKNLTKLTGILAAAALMSFFAACSSIEEKKDKKDSLSVDKQSREEYLSNIEKAEKTMRADSTFSSRLALEALKAYTDFTTLFPKDSLTPDYLFKAGQVAQSTGNFKQAAVYFETIIEQHKGYDHYVDACFVAANNYDDHLENEPKGTERAKQLYEYIITKYPNTSWANDSKVLLSFLGKSNEELLRSIEEKAKQNK